jgi:ubiquitin-protein ligase E3 C
LRYIHMVAHHRLNTEIRAQSAAFLRGFHQIIEPQWIAMFNRSEMQELLAGAEGDIDVADLRDHTLYSGGYTEDHPVVARFWRVFSGMDGEEQRGLLKFATSCSRPPLQGFAALEPHFCIHRGGQGEADEGVARLPSASTCMNLLKLPPYRSDAEMAKKMLYALSADAGFDLS